MLSRPRNADLISRNLGRKYSFSAKLEGHLTRGSREIVGGDGTWTATTSASSLRERWPHCSGWIRRPSPAGRPPGGSRASVPRADTAGSVSLKYAPCCGATANQHRNRQATRQPDHALSG